MNMSATMFTKYFIHVAIMLVFNKVNAENILTINGNKLPVHVMPKKFLSVALDTELVAQKFQHFDMTNTTLQKLVSWLAPGYLRIGGNAADNLIFSRNDSNEIPVTRQSDYTNFTMTGDEWLTLNTFTKKVGLRMLFDLNCLTRNADGSWNADNAKDLIAFSDEHLIDADWQLGNEPNAFFHKFNMEVNATQLAKDFATLRKILDQYPRYRKSKLVGPDTTRPIIANDKEKSTKYLREFLENSQRVLDAVSWHHDVNCDNVLKINANSPAVHVVSKEFLSVALDMSLVARKFKYFDMTNEHLLKEASSLAPGYLRVGGTQADNLIFSRDTPKNTQNNPSSYEGTDNSDTRLSAHANFTMTGKEWLTLNAFAKKVGLRMLFDLNCLTRIVNGGWNADNAIELLSFSDEHGIEADWQLGNEPDMFLRQLNLTVDPSQLAKDYSALRNILNQYPRYRKSKLVGPEVTRPKTKEGRDGASTYLRNFLKNSQHVLDAITFHQYYFDGKTADVKIFLDPATFNKLDDEINTVIKIAKETHFGDVPIWLTETSSGYGGGAPNLSDRFVASFLWLDKLGLSARYGLETVVRQTLFRGNYALLDANYFPSSDFWISWAYKKLVGPQVVNCSLNAVNTTRLYCHCSKLRLDSTAFVVFGMNLDDKESYVTIEGLENEANFVFYGTVFTAQNGDLTTKNVLLNGQLPSISSDGMLSELTPMKINGSNQLVMPAYSLVFWVIPSPNIPACL